MLMTFLSNILREEDGVKHNRAIVNSSRVYEHVSEKREEERDGVIEGVREKTRKMCRYSSP